MARAVEWTTSEGGGLHHKGQSSEVACSTGLNIETVRDVLAMDSITAEEVRLDSPWDPFHLTECYDHS